jgi:hypothetical protein
MNILYSKHEYNPTRQNMQNLELYKSRKALVKLISHVSLADHGSNKTRSTWKRTMNKSSRRSLYKPDVRMGSLCSRSRSSRRSLSCPTEPGQWNLMRGGRRKHVDRRIWIMGAERDFAGLIGFACDGINQGESFPANSSLN